MQRNCLSPPPIPAFLPLNKMQLLKNKDEEQNQINRQKQLFTVSLGGDLTAPSGF